MEQIGKNLRLEGAIHKLRPILHADFPAKLIVIKNGRMADDNKRMARTTSEIEAEFKKPKPSKASPSSWHCSYQCEPVC